jgi:hypothetical protein
MTEIPTGKSRKKSRTDSAFRGRSTPGSGSKNPPSHAFQRGRLYPNPGLPEAAPTGSHGLFPKRPQAAPATIRLRNTRLVRAPAPLLSTAGCDWIRAGLGNQKNAESGNRGACRRGEWLCDPTSSGRSGCARSDGGHFKGAGIGLHGATCEQGRRCSNRSVGL